MSKIRIEELSIGDWVYHDDIVFGREIAKVHRLNKDKHGETIGITVYRSDGAFGVVGYIGTSPTNNDIHPIPITQEILEKNGFIDYEVGKGWYVLNVADDLRVWLHRNSHDWTFQIMKWSPLSTHEIGKVFIKHTHQLQHALRLAGVDKEITL